MADVFHGNLRGTRKPFQVGTGTLQTSAQLQADSTTAGFLPPRMTTAQRVAISTPAEGLLVFDTDFDEYYVFKSTSWKQLSGVHIGDLAYYVDGTSGSDANGGTSWIDAKKTFTFTRESSKEIPRTIIGNLTLNVRGVVCSTDSLHNLNIKSFLVSGGIYVTGEMTAVATGLAVTGFENTTSVITHHSYITTTGAGWTVGAHKGNYVLITAGTGAGATYYPILDNTADTLELIAVPDLAVTSVYSIVSPSEIRGALTSDPNTLIEYLDEFFEEQDNNAAFLKFSTLRITADAGVTPKNWVRTGSRNSQHNTDWYNCSIDTGFQPLGAGKQSGSYSWLSNDGYFPIEVANSGGLNFFSCVFYATANTGGGIYYSVGDLALIDCRVKEQDLAISYYVGNGNCYVSNLLIESSNIGLVATATSMFLNGQIRLKDVVLGCSVADGTLTATSSTTFLVDNVTTQLKIDASNTYTFAEIGTKNISNAAMGSSVVVYNWATYLVDHIDEYDSSVKGVLSATTYAGAIDEILDNLQLVSVGAINAADGVDEGDGTMTFASTTVNLRKTTDHTGNIFQFVLAGVTLGPFTEGIAQYVVAEYNGGSPRLAIESDYQLITNSDRIAIWVVWRTGTTLHSLNSDNAGTGLANKIATMLTSTQAYRRAGDSGLFITESATPNPRTVVVTGSYVFAGFAPQIVSPYTSASDILTKATVAAGVWSFDSSSAVYNNTNYNPTTGSVALDPNKYSARWFYRSIGDIKEVFYVEGVGQHNKSTEAEDEGERTDLPNVIRQHCLLVGRSIVQEGVTNGAMSSAFVTQFTPSVVFHNDTQGIQGGTTNEYYHMTAAEDANVGILGTSWVDERRYGLVDPDNTTTLSFNPATYQVTLTPVNPTWSYWRNGVRHTVTGPKVATMAGTPPVAGTYFIYTDATDGTLTADTNAWTLSDTKVPVAIVAWDDSRTPKYLGPADERHSCEIHRAYHREHHFADGSELVTGGTIADYVVNESAPTGDDDNTFSVAETVFFDEDRTVTCALFADPSGAGGDCMTMTRTGANTYGWAWSDVPFVFTPAGYINWNNGGTSTQGQSGKFYCTYLFATNFAGDGRFMNLMGRGEYATLSEAQGENLGLFDMTGFPVAESIVLYRFVWASDSTYTTKGKVRLATEPTAIMQSFVTLQNRSSDKPVRVLNDLNDMAITEASLAVDQVIKYNGLQWVNGSPGAGAGAGPGTEFYFDNTSVIAAGAENTFALETLATTPTTDIEGTETVTVNASTAVCKAYVTAAALGRTSIDGGAYTYHVWAGVSNTASVSTLQASFHRVIPNAVYTATITGGPGTSRTCTISGGSHFVAGDANASLILAGYVQTPKGIYQITGHTSGTVVTIAVPAAYVNESAVAWSQWRYIGNIPTTDINTTTPTYTAFELPTVFGATACNATDKFGIIVTGTTTRAGSTVITWTREGSARYSHVTSSLGATHEQLQQLLGGGVNDHYHVTGAQATTLGGLTTVVQGDIAYASAANAWSILAKSTTVGHVLTNSGSSNNPAWAAITLNTLTDAYTDGTNNVLLGDTDQGSGITTGGVDNTGFGKDALDSLTTGHSNTCAGYMAGTAITDADHCTFFGAEAGKTASSSAGDQQVGIGYLALALSNGYGNVGIGSTAGAQINSGTYNMCLGHQAGFGITTTSSSTFIGASAGLAGNFAQRTAMGRHALEAGGGDDCTAVGYESLTACTAARNTAFGSFSGYAATTATDCVYLGWEAGYSNNTTGKLYIGNSRTSFLITGSFASGYVGINTDTYTGTVGSLIVKGSTNNGGTNVFVARDSDEAAVAALNTDGEWTTGSWHATTIAYDHGGTGLTAYPVKTIILPAASAALGTTTPATRETRELTTNKQVFDVLKFAHAGVCIAWWSFLLPDAYDGGVINAKITYMNVATDGTNNFLFSLSAGCAADGSILDLTMGTVQELETVVGDTAEDLKIGTWSTGVTPSGTPAGGKLLVLKLQRDPTDTAHDTTSLDAYVLGLRLEYTVNSWTD